MDSAEPRPRRRIARILFDASQVQIARGAPLLRIVAELIAAQEVLVRASLAGTSLSRHPLFARRERQRERLDDAFGELVLAAETVADRRLRGVGPQQRAGRGVGELRGHAISSPARSSVPVTIDVHVRFAPRWPCRRPVPPANRDAARLERTTSDSSPDSEA